jgi:hypothetical protein
MWMTVLLLSNKLTPIDENLGLDLTQRSNSMANQNLNISDRNKDLHKGRDAIFATIDCYKDQR